MQQHAIICLDVGIWLLPMLGAAWLARGLPLRHTVFAANAILYNKKVRKVQNMLETADFIGLQETHGEEGREMALELNIKHQSFWAHGNASWGGVGLLVKQDFLDHLPQSKKETGGS